MKKLVLLSAVLLIASVSTLSAKHLPNVASKVPTEFKTEIMKQINYPQFAENNLVEGEVWMKVALDDENMVKIVDLSSTNPKLGQYVKEQLADAKITSTTLNGQTYYLKVKFDLIDKK